MDGKELSVGVRMTMSVMAVVLFLGACEDRPLEPEDRTESLAEAVEGSQQAAEPTQPTTATESMTTPSESQPSSAPTPVVQGHEGHGEEQPGHHHGVPHPDFGDAEQWAEVFDAPERDEWQRPRDVVALLALSPGMTVADVGAGTGYFLPYLSEAVGLNGAVLGLDIEPGMVTYMQERATREGLTNVTARVVPTDDPELAAGTVDRVLIVNTWHHIENRPEYGGKLARSLRPGGAVFIVDYTMDSPRGPRPEHRLLPEAVVGELQSAGLTAELLDEPLPYQYVVVGRLP